MIKEKLRQYIIETFMDGNGNVDDDEQLFESGIVDSIGFMKMLVYIESTFNTPLDISEFTIESGTLNGIAEIVGNKVSSSA